MAYLDETGLAYLWGKIKDYINTHGGGGSVSGVKGDAETDYRTGNVNLTAANVGAVSDSVKSTSVNLSNLGSGTKTLYLKRQGNIVIAEFTATTAPSSANAAISAGTIPTGYRPDRNVYQGGPRVTNNSLNGTYRWRVASSGAVTFWTSSTGTYETPLTLAWYTANNMPS